MGFELGNETASFPPLVTCVALGAFTFTRKAALLGDGDGATRKQGDSTAWGTIHSPPETAPRLSFIPSLGHRRESGREETRATRTGEE